MAIVNRQIVIEWKVNPTFFAITNVKNLSCPAKRIGSAIGSVNRMITNDEMMRVLMPSLVGIDPSNTQGNWTKEVADWWHSLSVEVPDVGLKLDTSLNFDMQDAHPIRSKYVSQYVEKHKIKSSEEFAEYAMGTKGENRIIEDEMYRYAAPVKVYDYLLWSYSKGYRPVANSLETINKSPNIQFFMYDEEEKKVAKRKVSKTMTDAIKVYAEQINNTEKLRSVLMVITPNKTREYIKMGKEDVEMEAQQMLMRNPETFMNTLSDKALEERAKIERYVAVGVLKRSPDTKIIVDGIEITKVLGYTNDEAVVAFRADTPENKKYINELEFRFKEIVKSI